MRKLNTTIMMMIIETNAAITVKKLIVTSMMSLIYTIIFAELIIITNMKTSKFLLRSQQNLISIIQIKKPNKLKKVKSTHL